MKAWKIFMAGVGFGQNSPVRLTGTQLDDIIRELGIPERKIAKWRAQAKEDWRRR